MITQTKEVTINGVTRELEFEQIWGDNHAPGYTPKNQSYWQATERDCVLVTIGRGKKLWKTGLHAWGDDLHNMRPNNVNNRNNISLQGWNTDTVKEAARSQHKGQK